IVSRAVERPQAVVALDDRYRLEGVWQPSVYSSPSVILFVESAEAQSPDAIFAVDVTRTPGGDVVSHYRPAPDTTDQVSDELATEAERIGLNPDLTVEGQRFVLIEIYLPIGTTRNGFVTIFGSTRSPSAVFGRDQ